MMKRSFSVIYCDDVRFEKDERVSLMGIYGSRVACPSFPHVLSRLSVVVRFSTPVSDAIRQFGFKIMLGNDILVVNEMDKELLLESAKRAESVGDAEGGDKKFAIVQATVQFSPLLVPEPLVLFVFGCVDGEEVRLPGLAFVAEEQRVG